MIFHWYHAVPQELFQFVDLHVSYPGARTSALLLRCSGVAAAGQQAVTDGLSEWQPPEQTHTHTHTHICACINMHESCTHAPGCYLGKNTFTLIKKCMSFVLSEININEEVWFGMVGCSLITSVCVLVFAEEDAGKAGRVRVTERNTNADAYLCSVPALTFLWSHSHAVERTGWAGEEIVGSGHSRITVLYFHRARKQHWLCYYMHRS